MEKVKREIHQIDATGKTLGRLSTEIANLLRGKNKAGFTYHEDKGDSVEVINASKIFVSGNKMEDKKYYSHSGYLGNLKTKTMKELKNNMAWVLRHSVRGMLPDNKLRAGWLRRLKIYNVEKE